jgi:hypothetical protein
VLLESVGQGRVHDHAHAVHQTARAGGGRALLERGDLDAAVASAAAAQNCIENFAPGRGRLW